MPFDEAWDDGQTAHDDWLNAVENMLNRLETAVNSLGTQAGNVMQYRYSASTTAPPGTGQIRYDAVPPATSKLWVHKTSDDSIDISAAWSSWVIGDQIYIQNKTNAANFDRFDIIATPTISTDYVELAVTVNESVGTPFVGNNIISAVHVHKVIV